MTNTRMRRQSDLQARSDRTRATRGGATITAAGRQTAAYQHNQTDLEFVRAQAREIKGGAVMGTTSSSARRTKNGVAVETLEIAHEGFND